MMPVLEFLRSLSPEEKEALCSLVKEASGCYDDDGNLTEKEDLISVREVEEFLLPLIKAGFIPSTGRFQRMMKVLNYSEDDILSLLAGYGRQMGIGLSAR